MRFTDQMPFNEVDVLFFCFGHGKSEAFLHEHDVPSNVKIIDLAQDFRLHSSVACVDSFVNHPTPDCHDYVYGLPEINKEVIAQSSHVANPGCFATCIQ